MKTEIKDYLNGLRFGGPQTHRHITIIPLHTALNGAPSFIGLADAMDARNLAVTEISEGGSVPQLLVLNDSDKPVLIIDGEELLGAKQNRTLNTSILLKEHSRTLVPVSCTEQGRWAYSSAKFAMSDTVLERKIRSRKSRSVSASLSQGTPPNSNQGEVWEGINALHCKAGSSSPTSAMYAVFQMQSENLQRCLADFARQESQLGLLVLISGRVVGFDIVSRPEVYTRLHDKLVRSYVLDALLDKSVATLPTPDPAKVAREFINSLEPMAEQIFPSVGHGQDYRYGSPTLAGNALLHEHHVIHATFLTLEEAVPGSRPDNLSSLRQRRHFRES
jgi:hypothetical protein